MIKIICLLISQLMASEVCQTIPGTMRLIKTEGCASVTLCMGYAECTNKKEKSIGKIICKANKNLTCPDAEECLRSTFTDHKINISIQDDGKSDGIFKYCNSKKIFNEDSKSKTDVVNSRICNVVSGDYTIKGPDDRVKAITDTLGKKRVK